MTMFINNKELSDLILRVEDEPIPCHKVLEISDYLIPRLYCVDVNILERYLQVDLKNLKLKNYKSMISQLLYFNKF